MERSSKDASDDGAEAGEIGGGAAEDDEATLWPITDMRVCMQYTLSNSDINLKAH